MLFYKHFWRFLLLILLFSSELTYAKTSQLEPVIVQLPWKDQFEFAGFYAAKEKGFYKDLGLDVTFKEFDPNQNVIDEVLIGNADYGIVHTSLISRYLQGEPLVFLANFFKYSPLIIVTQPTYTLPSDLKGKKVKGADSGESLLAMFKKFNIDKSDFENITSNFNINDFVNKKIDAMSVYITNEIYELQKSGIKYNILNPTVYGVPSYDINLFTTQKELAAHPKRVSDFTKASIRGWQYALSHKEELIQIILKKYNTQHKTYEALKYEAEQIQNIILPSLFKIGSIDPKKVKMIAENFMELGLAPKNSAIDINHFLYHTPPPELRLTEEEKDYLKIKQQITYCADPIWMPFSQIKKGIHTGMDADYTRLFSTIINHPFELVATESWEETIKNARDNKCDLLTMIMKTPIRTQYFNFTKPFVSTPIALATTIDKPFIDNLYNLSSGKAIGIVKGYALQELITYKYPHLKLVEIPNIEEGLKRVANGTLYGFIDNLTTLGYQINKNYIGSLKISSNTKLKAKFGFAVRKDDPLLLSILNQAIDTITPAQHQEIYNRWNTITVNNNSLEKDLFWKLLIGIIFLLPFIVYHFIKIRRTNKTLHELSIKDTLSRLFNRRYIEHLIHAKGSNDFSLILLDIDHFKKINDTYGHNVGDRVIRELSELLKKELSDKAIISRWGGEEFLILCYHCSIEKAKAEAERLRKAIQEHDFGLDWKITGSFGVAKYPKSTIKNKSYIQKVDEALQKAKSAGKNQVAVYHVETEE